MKKAKLIIIAFILILITFSLYITTKNSSQLNLDRLKSLPYLEYSEEEQNTNLSGVTLYNKKLAYDTYKIIDEEYIIDIKGNLLVALPGTGNLKMLFDDGSVIDGAWGPNIGSLAKYDKNFDLIWEKNIPLHHDLRLSYNNTFLTILIEKKNYKGRIVIFDSIARLSDEGEILDKWSTFDHLDEIKKYHYKSRLETPLSFWDKLIHKIPAELEEYDYYHINSVQEIPKNTLGEFDNRFQEGNLLVSLHNVNIIIILDKDSKKIVWSLNPDLIIGTHMPTMLETGNLLIFDNGDGIQRSYSRVLELNPITEEVVWRYIGTPPESFYTKSMGSAQRLPNGNTLITESDKGHVFEIAPDKEIVWEYYIPYFDEEGRRQVIYRALMVDKNKIDSLLKIWDEK